jgi:FkbM family methyltransferase
MQKFLELVDVGATVVDVGANIGYFTLTAASRVGRSGRVISVEPNPRAAERLRENVALNGLHNVTAIEAAVSSTPGTMALRLGADSEASSLFDAVHASIGVVDVLVTTIDKILADQGLTRIDVLKLDVEGAEVDALLGAAQLLSGSHPPRLLLEANPVTLRAAGRSVDDLRRCIESFGYTISEIETLRWQGEDVQNWLATRE